MNTIYQRACQQSAGILEHTYHACICVKGPGKNFLWQERCANACLKPRGQYWREPLVLIIVECVHVCVWLSLNCSAREIGLWGEKMGTYWVVSLYRCKPHSQPHSLVPIQHWEHKELLMCCLSHSQKHMKDTFVTCEFSWNMLEYETGSKDST